MWQQLTPCPALPLHSPHFCPPPRPQGQDAAIAASGGAGDDAPEDIDQLREDVETALGEAALAQERQQLLQLEVGRCAG